MMQELCSDIFQEHLRMIYFLEISPERAPNSTEMTNKDVASSFEWKKALLNKKHLNELEMIPGNLIIVEDFCSMLQFNTCRDIPTEGIGQLRLPRQRLVEHMISLATSDVRKQVLLQGPAGSGKTTVLSHIGQYLEAQNERVLVATHPDNLPSCKELVELAKQDPGSQERVGETGKVQDRPLYLLVDEAQQSYNRGTLFSLLKMHPANRNIVIIAVGIPGKVEDKVAFKHRIASDKVLLTVQELCEDKQVVEFFQHLLITVLSSDHALQLDSTQIRTATVNVLKFAHSYTAGHTYACLKLTEYCILHHAKKCMHDQMRVSAELGLALCSQHFLSTAGKEIFNRCFPYFAHYNSIDTFAHLYVRGSDKLEEKMSAHGLWDHRRNCMFSPLLQYHFFNLVRKRDDFTFDHPSQIGQALLHCLKEYNQWNFQQYELGFEFERELCEDGVAYLVGCELSKYCKVCPQPQPQSSIQTPRLTQHRQGAVTYYLGGAVNMLLMFVTNGNQLEERLDHYLRTTTTTGIHIPFAVVDVNFETTEPRQLPERYYYTFVIQTHTLYCGKERVTSSAVSSQPDGHRHSDCGDTSTVFAPVLGANSTGAMKTTNTTTGTTITGTTTQPAGHVVPTSVKAMRPRNPRNSGSKRVHYSTTTTTTTMHTLYKPTSITATTALTPRVVLNNFIRVLKKL